MKAGETRASIAEKRLKDARRKQENIRLTKDKERERPQMLEPQVLY